MGFGEQVAHWTFTQIIFYKANAKRGIFEKLVTWSETNGVHNLYALDEKIEICLMEFREHLGKIQIKFLKIGIVLKSQYNIVTLK